MEYVYLLLSLVTFVCIFVALIKPSVFAPVLKSWATRKRAVSIFSAATFVLIILIGITVDPVEPAKEAETNEAAQNEPVAESNNVVSTETAPTAEVAVLEEKPQEFYDVVRAVDGDTLVLNLNGTSETIRLIGMDTPETVDPRKAVQCFGKEASSKAKETLTGKKVRIEADPTQGERDKYNRLLLYIFLEDGTFYNKMMIQEGYAHEYTYNTPYKYQNEFKEAETSARENKRGFWGDTCNGDTTKAAASEQKTTTVTPAPAVAPKTTPKSSGGGYACNCGKTCPNMSCSEAQYQLNTCGCSARDADDDGVACDSQCQ